MNTTRFSTLSTFARTLGSMLLGAASLTACGGPQAHQAAVQLVDHTKTPLSFGALNEINGTYGAQCSQRAGQWSTAIGGYVGTLDNAQLSVLDDDVNCVLSVDSVLIGTDTFLPMSSFSLTDSYRNTAVAFKKSGSSEVAFYANFKLNDPTYQSAILISLVYSDDADLASAGSSQATYRVHSASSTQGTTPPPDYVADSTSVAVETNINQSILSVVGSVDLTDGSVTGQKYVILTSDLGSSPSFDTINTAFEAGTAVAISGSNPSIDAADLGLVGASLAGGAITRTILVQNSANGVVAYQVLKLTIEPSV